jgi:glutathione S-transferase
MLTLFGDPNSGNCLKVSYTAALLGLPLSWEKIDVTRGQTRTPEFLAMSDMAQVPVLRLADGRTLAQSNAIIRYLARDSALIPQDAFLEAKMDELLFWEQYSHEPYVAVCRYHMFYLGKPKETRDPQRVERGEAALDLLERRLAGTEWLVGDAMSLADISLLAYTRLAEEGGFDLEARPNLTAWIARCERKLGLKPRRQKAAA